MQVQPALEEFFFSVLRTDRPRLFFTCPKHKAQQNYSQIEKEALALVSAVERFRKFIYGRHFILQTDHRPLLALFKTSNTKGLDTRSANRLKRWALRLIGFDFDIEYIRTENFGQADALSRL